MLSARVFIAVASLLVAMLALAGCGPAGVPDSEPSGAAADESLTVAQLRPSPHAPAQLAPTPTATRPQSALPRDPDEPISVPVGDEPRRGDTFAASKSSAGFAQEPPYKFVGDGAAVKGSKSALDRASGQKPSAQQQAHTWRDGDRTMTVWLQNDLTVTRDGEIKLRVDSDPAILRSDGVDKAASAGLPVFRDQAGSLMTLPGGVLLALDESWSRSQTDAFFADNGIHRDRVSELDFLANGFLVDTEPGWASLQLANQLAAQSGVSISSPNWTRERVAR